MKTGLSCLGIIHERGAILPEQAGSARHSVVKHGARACDPFRRVNRFGADIEILLQVRDGVDERVLVKDEPTEMMKPAEEMLRALGSTELLGQVLDGRTVYKERHRADNVMTEVAEKLKNIDKTLPGKSSGGGLGFCGGVADNLDELRIEIDTSSQEENTIPGIGIECFPGSIWHYKEAKVAEKRIIVSWESWPRRGELRDSKLAL